jgi:glycosyltransferase involved in cell wall biosynthesis
VTAPLVSIVIANHNYGRFVSEAIESALGQRYRPIEVVVVDDGSSDDSREVVAHHSVRLVAQEKQGVCRARNRGARECKGELIMFLDADDVLEPDYVERCLDALDGAGARVAYAYTQMRLFGDENWVFEAIPFHRNTLLERNYIHASALIRRAAFDEVGGFNARFALGHEDHELWVRMVHYGYTGVYVPAPLLRYRRHGRTRDRVAKERLEEITWRLHLTYPRFYWREYVRHPLSAARWYRRLGAEIGRPEPWATCV